jgi:predicted amidohydrolase YtcJ
MAFTGSRIDACFDSHVHWAATGEFAGRLKLQSLTSPQAVDQLKVEAHHRRGAWLVGFGWDDTDWTEKPHREVLDRHFPDRPVAFSRCDAHALWVNTLALKMSGLWESDTNPTGGRIERDQQGRPTGILVDQACEPIQRLLPEISSLELRGQLLRGVKTFNDAGFTHIRDMTCEERHWLEALKLDESGLLTLAVEEYFWLKDSEQLTSVLQLLSTARGSASANLRPQGVKLFLDGALGSEGAWLSRCYHGSEQQGLVLWEAPALREVLIKTWKAGFAVAVHAIGDAAAETLVSLALELKEQGHRGPLHIEHAEILRPETIAKMSGLALQCHLQPTHWLSDRRWLQKKIGDLSVHAFPWRRLQEANLDFDFGSDAPIEPASIARTLQALRESGEAGVPRLLGSPTSYMTHKDTSWAPNSFTLVEDETPTQVVFRGQHLL